MSLALRDLVRVPVEMLVIGSDRPVKFTLRGRVSAVVDGAVEVSLLDDFAPLNGYPLHYSREAARRLEKLNPPPAA